MAGHFVDGKPITLSQLVALLTGELAANGDCEVMAGCRSEGIGGPPSITRNPQHGLIFDFYGITLEDGERLIWGTTGEGDV